MPDLIDSEELPFTTDELYRGACRFLAADMARTLADHMTECGPGLIKTRLERRAEWRAAGVAGAGTMRLHGWVYPEDLLPALASLSGDVEVRARGILEGDLERRRQAMVQASQRKAAERAGIIPTREEMIRRLERDGISPSEGNQMQNVVSTQLPSMPPPTAEMEAAAVTYIQAKRYQMDALIARFRALAADG